MQCVATEGYLSQQSMTKPPLLGCSLAVGRACIPVTGRAPLLHFTGHLSLGPVLVCLPPTIKHGHGPTLTCSVRRGMLPV